MHTFYKIDTVSILHWTFPKSTVQPSMKAFRKSMSTLFNLMVKKRSVGFSKLSKFALVSAIDESLKTIARLDANVIYQDLKASNILLDSILASQEMVLMEIELMFQPE